MVTPGPGPYPAAAAHAGRSRPATGASGRPLPVPAPGPIAAEAFVADHLSHLIDRRAGRTVAVPTRATAQDRGRGRGLAAGRFRGGQRAAETALARFRVDGYRAAADVVYPQRARRSSALSPWIRNGLLSLVRLWDHVEGGPSPDVAAFRDALVANEVARLTYAGIPGLHAEPDPDRGPRPGPGRRFTVGGRGGPGGEWAHEPVIGWDRRMGCVELALDELDDDGWLPHGGREWLLHLWLAQAGVNPDDGGAHFFRHLLDGSQALNRRAWRQAAADGADAAMVSRWQVERRAPGLCATCPLAARCPIDHEIPGLLTGLHPIQAPAVPGPDVTDPYPSAPGPPVPAVSGGPASRARNLMAAVDPTDPRLGPAQPVIGPGSPPEAVWITAESMGDADPALAAHPDLPAVFVFDEPLLADLRLAAKRLVFLTEHLSDLATRRPVEIWLGRPQEVMLDRPLAVTYTPVPGWHRRSRSMTVAALHPWPWLVRSPVVGSAGSGSYSP